MLTDRRISMNGPLASRMMNFGLKPKPTIEIKLADDQQAVYCPSYTSLEEIKGEVSITVLSDMSFDEVYITFEGAASTFVEKAATASPTNGKTKAYHPFLRLSQPMDIAAFPEPRILEAGKIYKFPFTFNVPAQILPHFCTHPKADDFPEGAHLQLPPSLGDPMVASMGRSLMDDLAPHMSSIAYSIRCRITNGRGTSGRLRVVTEASKRLRIIPAVEEEPPLNVEGDREEDYKLRKEKVIRKGLFKGKLGCLVMQSEQPTSLRLPPVRSQDISPVTTMATVKVRFDPADERSQPPSLNNLQVKLRVATYFATVAMRELPIRQSDFHFSSVQGIYVEDLKLSSRCLANQQWEKHASSTPAQRASLRSSLGSNISIPEPSSAYKGQSFYTASIVVPISLPKDNKVFVPTFNSCLICRNYALDLYLSITPPNATVTDPVLHLRIPVQISSEGNPNALPAISAAEASAFASREAYAYFDYRGLTPPRERPSEQAQLTLEDAPPSPGPGYTHRQDSTEIAGLPTPVYSVRMHGTQQRFQSLSFENEEAALAPPPDYSAIGGRHRGRIESNVPSQLGHRRVDSR